MGRSLVGVPIWVVLSILPAGCGSSPKQPPRETSEPMNDTTRVEDTRSLSRLEGKRVLVVGRVTTTQWPHMSATLDGHPHENLVEVGSGRVVVYTRSPIDAKGDVEIRGTVLELTGAKGSKDEGSSEYHVVADRWRPVEGGG